MSFQRFGVTFFLMTLNNKHPHCVIDGRTALHRPANSAAAPPQRGRLAPKLSPPGKERRPMIFHSGYKAAAAQRRDAERAMLLEQDSSRLQHP
jgi:hypothetical protein